MGNSLCSGDVSSLRGNSFIFSRNVRLDRFAIPAGHDLARRGRLRRDDDVATVLQRNKDQREQEFCLVQRALSFCGMGMDLLKTMVSSLAGFPPMNYLNNYHCITMKQQNKAAKMTAQFSEPSGRATIPDELQRSENDPFLEIHQAVSKEAIRREALIGLLL